MSETFDPHSTPDAPADPPVPDAPAAGVPVPPAYPGTPTAPPYAGYGPAPTAPGAGTYPPGPGAASPPLNPGQPLPPGVGPDDTWIRTSAGAGAGGPGAGDIPPGPWGTAPPPNPWDAGGQWGAPGHWGAPPIWIPPQQVHRNNPLRVLAVAAAVVVVAAVGVAVGRTSIQNDNGGGLPTVGASIPTPRGSGGSSGTDTIAAKVDPSVVDIITRLGFDSGEAAGTGMVLTSSGEVLTNNHVIDGATSISVTDIGNGRTYNATVVGTDKTDDIAILRLVNASGLKTVDVGDSSSVAVGDAVTAIGNAGGRGGTPSVATGNVTDLDQSITASDQSDGSSEQLTGLIQTTVPLQPGDSGGPLVNSQGQVVGIDTAASSGFEFSQAGSQGFAIPINHALDIGRQIMAGKSSDTIHIGPAALIGVRVRDSSASGAAVVTVEPGSPADGAGLVSGDVITSLGGHNVDSARTLTDLMQRHHPGETVRIGWVDLSGQPHSATIQLTTGPAG